ncbi:hypothetical protein [Microtetraspora niveoalba]|uniref:hypothetical protein n=1 Tax=Microtetraspora niveoalba TaxID=46175 RepID=UPI000833AFDB|nr:hypothetical protein [Microtetraspora niveoalba]
MERDRYDSRYGNGRAATGEEPVGIRRDAGSEGQAERHSRFEGPGPVYSPEEAEATWDTGEAGGRGAPVAPEGFEPSAPVRREDAMPQTPARDATGAARSGGFERPGRERAAVPAQGDVLAAGRPGGTSRDPGRTGVTGEDSRDAGQEGADTGQEFAGIDVDRRWRDIKAAFVDDPRGSVEQADALVGEAVSAITERRHSLADHWKNPDVKDTEELRLALREYRTLLTRLTGK